MEEEKFREKRMRLSKEEILSEIRQRKAEFSKEELIGALGGSYSERSDNDNPSLKQKIISNTAYFIGAIVVVIGVIILVAQFWGTLSSPVKIAVTLGLGLLMFATVVFLEKRNGEETPRVLKESLAVVSVVLVVFGAVTLSDIADLGFTPFMQVVTTLVLIFMFGGLRAIRRSDVYSFLIVASTTWLLFAVLSLDAIQRVAYGAMREPVALYFYLTSLIGLSYIISVSFYSEKLKIGKRLTGPLSVIGSLALVVPFFSLSFIYTGAWDLVSILAIAGLIILGGYKHEKRLAGSGGLLLAVFIIIISFRYFADTLGWPFALILAGLLLMAAGYSSYYLFSKLSKQNS